MTKKQLVKRMDGELRRVERQAVSEARRVSRRFVNAAIKEFRETGKINVKTLKKELKQPLLDAMVATNLLGMKRAKLISSQRKSLSLGLNDTLRALKKSLNVTSLNKVQKQFDTQALRILNDVTNSVEKSLRKIVLEEVERGSSKVKSTKALRKKFDELGLTSINDSQLTNIFNTQSQIAFQAGRYIQSREDDTEDILWGYQYFTAGDEKVRFTHEKQDGVILPKDDPYWKIWWPPNGWN